MKVSQIKIRKSYSEGNLRAIVSVVLGDCIAIHEIKVIQGNDRLFVAMPNHKMDDGKSHDIIHPINSNMRQFIEQAILGAYNSYILGGEAYT